MFQFSQLWKASIGLVAAVFIGAIGSGVWEALLKPSLASLSTIALSIATLGVNSVRDQMYMEIATGQHERAAIVAMAFLLMSASGLLMSLIAFYFGLIRGKEKVSQIDPDINKSESRALNINIQRTMKINLIFAIFWTTTAIFYVVQINYIVRASSYLHQMQAIIGCCPDSR